MAQHITDMDLTDAEGEKVLNDVRRAICKLQVRILQSVLDFCEPAERAGIRKMIKRRGGDSMIDSAENFLHSYENPSQ